MTDHKATMPTYMAFDCVVSSEHHLQISSAIDNGRVNQKTLDKMFDAHRTQASPGTRGEQHDGFDGSLKGLHGSCVPRQAAEVMP